MTICKYCRKEIKHNGILWVESGNVPFPQYCTTQYQNASRDQKHKPYKDIQTKDTAYNVSCAISHEELRAMRRQFINNHAWTLRKEHGWDFRLHNIRLMVRLYELQFYGVELQAYK